MSVDGVAQSPRSAVMLPRQVICSSSPAESLQHYQPSREADANMRAFQSRFTFRTADVDR